MIKENAKRTLVWLYSATTEERWLSKDRISLILAHLTPAGVRSLLYSLEKKQLVFSQRVGGEINFALTNIGKALIETEIIGLSASSQAEPQWSMLIFLKPPKSDRNFRYLRLLLLQQHWLTVSRGVFISPAQPIESLIQVIAKLYAQSVIVLGIKDWRWGDIRLVIGQTVGASQVDDIYSGISREIDRLISEVLSKNELNHQDKSQILSVFDRLYSTLKLDFTQVLLKKRGNASGVELLSKLQLLG